MVRIFVIVFSFLLVFSTATPSQAQEFTFALGATDFDDTGADSAVFDIEYRHKPFVQRRVRSHALGANASVSAEGDVFIGGGMWTRWKWDSGWFIDTSLMPGLFEEGTSGNYLGSTFIIRSQWSVGYNFGNGRAVSAAVSHKSNAGLADENPGMNTYSIRYHFEF
jgi:lipid A 3-O-deacylase